MEIKRGNEIYNLVVKKNQWGIAFDVTSSNSKRGSCLDLTDAEAIEIANLLLEALNLKERIFVKEVTVKKLVVE